MHPYGCSKRTGHAIVRKEPLVRLRKSVSMQLKGSGFEARHMACADDTIPRPVVEVLFLKSFRRAVTVIGIGATRIRWERRITKKRTYEKVV